MRNYYVWTYRCRVGWCCRSGRRGPPGCIHTPCPPPSIALQCWCRQRPSRACCSARGCPSVPLVWFTHPPTHPRAHIHPRTPTHVLIHTRTTHVHAHICPRTQVHTHSTTHIHPRTHIHSRTHACQSICTHTNTRAHTHTHGHTCERTHTIMYSHTHAHTRTFPRTPMDFPTLMNPAQTWVFVSDACIARFCECNPYRCMQPRHISPDRAEPLMNAIIGIAMQAVRRYDSDTLETTVRSSGQTLCGRVRRLVLNARVPQTTNGALFTTHQTPFHQHFTPLTKYKWVAPLL